MKTSELIHTEKLVDELQRQLTQRDDRIAELEAILHAASKPGYDLRYEGWGGRWKKKCLNQAETLALWKTWAERNAAKEQSA